MDALTEKQQALIVKNLVAACKNIEKKVATDENLRRQIGLVRRNIEA